MKKITISLAQDYFIHLGHDLLKTVLLKEYCIKLNKRIVIVTDSHLENSHGKNCQLALNQQGLNAELIVFPAGEKHKTRENKEQIENELLQKEFSRDTCLIALGGGVVTDLVGFVAATFCRGIPVIYIPTTLLAMVDASIGGKTAVNTPYGKNIIGTFSQPHAVLIDLSYLKTLPDAEWNNGIVEMIKHSVIADSKAFADLKQYSNKNKLREASDLIDLIYTSCHIKKTIVEQDANEQGMRQLLNFGHTIGHAIETLEEYRLSHGEAVAIGMLVESYLSLQCGYLRQNDLSILEESLKEYGLPLKTTAFNDRERFIKQLRLDKKTINKTPHFVLLERLGQPFIHNGAYSQAVNLDDLHKALDWARTRFQ